MGPVLLALAASLVTLSAALGLAGNRLATVVFRSGMAFAWATLAVIVAALIRVDTSLELVVSNTRPGLGTARRVMGLWGGSAGSLLFFGVVVGTTLATLALTGRRAAIPAAVTAPFLWASVFVASPFTRLDVPAIAGSGLSPILEHWAMLIHPPLLYLGLALSLLPAILDGSASSDRIARYAMAVLTTALALGGGWAYVELGWGGWWAWDPVENAALIPWLLLVVHLHLPRNHSVRRWAGLLVWPTVFAGTAMTRTSLRTSVHAFANAEDLGWFLWPVAAAVGVGALAAGLRLPRAQPISARRFLPVLIAFSSALVVALGTFRPFLPGDGTDGTFYSRYLWPVAIVGMVGLGVAPRSRNLSQRTQVRLVAEVGVGALIGMVLAAAAGWTLWWQLVHAASLGAGLLTAVAHRQAPRRTAAHVGMLFVLAGALGGTASVERTVNLDLGETVEVAGHVIENRGAELVAQNPPVIEAELLLDDHHALRPQLTVYAERALRLPEIATHSRLHEDVQAVLRSADDDGSIVATINVEPLTQLVWIGAVLVTGAMLAPARVRNRPSSVEPSAAR